MNVFFLMPLIFLVFLTSFSLIGSLWVFLGGTLAEKR